MAKFFRTQPGSQPAFVDTDSPVLGIPEENHIPIIPGPDNVPHPDILHTRYIVPGGKFVNLEFSSVLTGPARHAGRESANVGQANYDH